MSAQRHDAQRVYAVWQRVIADEALSDAVVENRLDDLSELFDRDEMSILRDFASEPGFRWAVENLRYRATTMIVRNLQKRMPATVRLLTGGNHDWLWDLASEYLVRHRWLDLGHRYNSECLRFAEFITRRVARRRALGDECLAALAYESGILTSLVRASEQVAWPAAIAREDNQAWQPRRNPSAVVARLPVDLLAWLQSGDGPPVPTSRIPLALLLYVPTVDGSVQIERLTDHEAAIFNAVSGDSPVTLLARDIGQREGIDPGDVEHVLRRWQRFHVLM